MSKHAVVLGAGVIGVSCAYYLAKAGWRVTLVDRGRVGGGCSHGNCGYVSPSHVLPHAGPGAITSTLKTLFQANSPLKVRARAVLGNLGWFRGFAHRCNERDMLHAAEGIAAILKSSRSLFDELLTLEAMDVEWDQHGLLFVFNTPSALEHYKHIDELLTSKFNSPARRFDREQLTAMETSLKPEAVSGAYLYESDAQLRPDVLMKEWRTRLQKLSVEVIENCELMDFVRAGSVAKSASMDLLARRASEDDNEDSSLARRANQSRRVNVEADAFVIATGAWTPHFNAMLGAKVPIIPGKGYSITMPRPALCPKYPMIFEEHRVAISPFQSGYRIGSTMEFAGYDDSLNRKRLQLLRDGAAFYLKEPFAEPVQEEWWGWRPMVYDGKPIIDFSPKFGNVLIAAGHGMLGLSMATGTGKLVSEMLSQTTPHIDPTHYSLERFK